MYIHIYIHSYICTYIHTYIHTYVHTYIRTYIHMYIHTYVHTYIHAFIHTYVHMYMSMYCYRRLKVLYSNLHTYVRTHKIQAFAKWLSQMSFDSWLNSELWTHLWRLVNNYSTKAKGLCSLLTKHVPVEGTPYHPPFAISRVSTHHFLLQHNTSCN